MLSIDNYLLIIFIGLIMITAGIILLIIDSLKKEKNVETGGVLIIGPIPIVFGSSREAAYLAMILAIVLTILAIILFLTINIWARSS